MKHIKTLPLSLLAVALIVSMPILAQADATATQSIEAYLKAAESGDPKAMYQLALKYDAMAEKRKSFFWYKKAADANFVDAIFMLATLYYYGDEGVGKDINKALSLFKTSADLGNSSSMYYLGRIYEKGQGISKDLNQAVYWYNLAKNKGHRGSLKKLAYAYENGIGGLLKSPQKAKDIYEEYNKEESQFDLNSLGIKKEETILHEKANKFKEYKLAAEKGQPNEMLIVAVFYETGVGTKKDTLLAEEWYRKSIMQNKKNVRETAEIRLINLYVTQIRESFSQQQKQDLHLIVDRWQNRENNIVQDGIISDLAWLLNHHGNSNQKDKEKSINLYKMLKKPQNFLSFKISSELLNANSWQVQELLWLIYMTESLDKGQKQYWFDILPSMSKEHAEKLHMILVEEKIKLDKLDEEYVSEVRHITKKHLIHQIIQGIVDPAPETIMQIALDYGQGRDVPQSYNQSALWYLRVIDGSFDTKANSGLYVQAKMALDDLMSTDKITDTIVLKYVKSVFKQPPSLSFVTRPNSKINQEALQLSVNIKDNGTGIGNVRLLVNGVAVDQQGRGLARTDNTSEQRTFSLKLPKGTHQLTIEAYNAENLGEVAKLETTITSTYQKSYKPRLHAIVIGIDQYKNSQLKLNYAVSDANAMYASINKQIGGLYDAGSITLLTTPTQTSKQAIQQAINQVKQNAQLADVFVFYVAGHGISYPEAGYYMLTSDVLQPSQDRIVTTALAAEELQDLIAQVPTQKKLVLLDTCNSGGAFSADKLVASRGLDDQQMIDRMKRKSGATILMASESTEQAREGYKGHGLFTYAVLQALAGQSDYDKDGYVDSDEIKKYVEDTVPEIAEKHFKTVQSPFASSSGQGLSFKVN